jgi:uncharacterized protein (TIGR00369 family)
MSAPETERIWEQEPRGAYPDRRLLALTGRERLESWGRGRAPAPPLTRLTGATIAEVGSGTASAEMPATGWLLNSAGSIGGGTLAIVSDIAFGCSIQTELPAATPYTTAELSMSFLRPARLDTRLHGGGQAIHVGRSVALSGVFLIESGTDRLIAHGTSRCAVLPPIEPVPDHPDDLPPVELDPDLDTDPHRRPWPADAILPQETWEELSGMEIVERQLAGELPAPPIHYLTGLRPVEAAEGSAVVKLPATVWLSSPARTVQGGVIATLADTAMAIAVQTTTAPGTAFAGLDLKVNYLRPVHPDGRELTARASLVHAGRTLVIARAEVLNEDDKPVALATGSSMYLPGRPAQLGELELGAEADEGVDQ